MDKTYIDEQHMVARFLQGRLAGDELAAFEIYMLDHPEIVDEVEYAKGMQEALENARDELKGGGPSRPQTKSPAGFWLGRKYAVAATVLLAVAATFSVYLYQQIGGLRDEVSALRKPVTLADDVWLEPARGERERVIASAEGRALVLRVDVSAAQAPSYTAELRGDEAGFLWTRSEIQADDEQSIRLLLSNLPTGRYQLSVSVADGIDSTAPVAEYRFLLRRADE